MLNKKICKMCWNKNDNRYELFEEDWKEGVICCLSDFIEERIGIFRNIKDKPPNECYFILEQTLIKWSENAEEKVV